MCNLINSLQSAAFFGNVCTRFLKAVLWFSIATRDITFLFFCAFFFIFKTCKCTLIPWTGWMHRNKVVFLEEHILQNMMHCCRLNTMTGNSLIPSDYFYLHLKDVLMADNTDIILLSKVFNAGLLLIVVL